MNYRDVSSDFSEEQKATAINLKTAVAGPKMAHLRENTLSFEFPMPTLTLPGSRSKKFQNP